MKTQYSLNNNDTQTPTDKLYKDELEALYSRSSGSYLDKLSSFTKFVPRQILSNFLAKNEIFKQVTDVHGSVIECGVHSGSGLFTWAQLSSIYEPYNHNRKVIGFDTFSGFPSISSKDCSQQINQHRHEGGLKFEAVDELMSAIRLFDVNRPIGHVDKIQLISGNAEKEIPRFIDDNPHLVVSLLYLDFDLYEPTRVAIDCFKPRMPKGSIIAFDELNQRQWPGETVALIESIGIDKLALKRFPFAPFISYAVLG